MATDVLSRAQEPANGPGSGTAMSWVNTPMSSLLGISRSGGASEWDAQVVIRASTATENWFWAQKNAPDLIASVPHGPKVQTVTSLFGIINQNVLSILSHKVI